MMRTSKKKSAVMASMDFSNYKNTLFNYSEGIKLEKMYLNASREEAYRAKSR